MNRRKIPFICLLVLLLQIFSNSFCMAGLIDETAFVVREGRKLAVYARHLDESINKMEQIIKSVSPTEPLSISMEENISNWFFSFRNVRRALNYKAVKLENFSRKPGLSDIQRQRALKVSFAAAILWFKSAVYLYDRPTKIKMLDKKLNEANPELNIAEYEADEIEKTVADSKIRDAIDEGFDKSLKLINFSDDFDKFYLSNIVKSYEYIKAKRPPTFIARLEKITDLAAQKIFKEYYPLHSAISVWIGDQKYAPGKKPLISWDRVGEMKDKLKPGDIILERENWFMSNIFLPGFWPHSILYVGTVEDLRKMGLADHPAVAKHLKEYSERDHLGFEKRIIEAVSDGVVMNSLEEACDADYICAFRPRLSEKEIKEVIIKAFGYVGRRYDFMFDFQTEDEIVCSELIYRSFRDKLSLTLSKIAGRWALPSLNIVKKFAYEKDREDRELDFVFFVDSDPKTGRTWFSSEKELINTISRPTFDVILVNR
ncbi:MAG: hypothetical protein HQM10_22130 [Candidatus Riflebacteria bacterium]|nr:hypothetical protein [Candidatus Riflebacteria bacterium]